MNNKKFKKKPNHNLTDNYTPPFDANALTKPIESLNLNEITLNLLKGANNNTILDLVKKTEKDYYRIMTFNKKNLLEVINKLKVQGFHLKPMPEVKPIEVVSDQKIENKIEKPLVSNVNNVKKENLDNRKEKVNSKEFIDNKKERLNNKEFKERTDNRPFQKNNEQNKNNLDKPKLNINKPLNSKTFDDRSDFSFNKNFENKNKNYNNSSADNNRNNEKVKHLDALKLNPITLKLVKSSGIRNIDELLIRGEKELMKIKGFKKRDLFHILEQLAVLGFSMPTEDVDVKPKRPTREIIKEEPDIYVKVNKNGKWGFLDRNNKQVIAPLYDEVFCFKDDVCCVELNEKFGYINRAGEVIVPITYDCACSFSEGLACVYKNNKCGYIDKENNVVIDFIFDAGTPVIDRNCRVKRDGKWGELFIDNPNEIRWII